MCVHCSLSLTLTALEASTPLGFSFQFKCMGARCLPSKLLTDAAVPVFLLQLPAVLCSAHFLPSLRAFVEAVHSNLEYSPTTSSPPREAQDVAMGKDTEKTLQSKWGN